jgi:hypothetical protein
VLVLGLIVLLAVVVGAVAALVLAGRQARDVAEPGSEPGDFVAPVSSGGYRWRRTDESTEEFRARVARENAAVDPPPGSPRSKS